MKSLILNFFIFIFFICNWAQASSLKIDGLNFYTLGDDEMPWFDVDDSEDLIDLSKIDCQWSHGKKTKCRIHLSPLYNFPKNGLSIQNEIVRSGRYAWKFINGDGDCGQQRKSDECKTFRERSEVSMLGLKSKNTWFKFSIFIPSNSEFTTPISNTIWQIHSKTGPVNFMFRVGPNGHLLWTDFVNNSFGGSEYHKILDAKYVKNQWNDFVVNIDFVKWPEKSFIKVWVNNKLAVNYYGLTNNNLSKQSYMKFGIYKSNINRFNTLHKGNPPKRDDTIVYYDAISIAKKCKDLKLENENNSCEKLR